MHRAQEDHRSSTFPALTRGLLEDLRPVFGSTAGRPFIFASTGTGMWEAALTNTLVKAGMVAALAAPALRVRVLAGAGLVLAAGLVAMLA